MTCNYVIDSSQMSAIVGSAILDFTAKTFENRSDWLKNNENQYRNFKKV